MKTMDIQTRSGKEPLNNVKIAVDTERKISEMQFRIIPI